MEGFAFLLAIIGIGFVILWAMRNDHVSLGGKTFGLLAMSEKKEAKGSKGRRPAERRDRLSR